MVNGADRPGPGQISRFFMHSLVGRWL